MEKYFKAVSIEEEGLPKESNTYFVFDKHGQSQLYFNLEDRVFQDDGGTTLSVTHYLLPCSQREDEVTAQKFLESKGVFSLDTKKRTQEVYDWMEEYAILKLSSSSQARGKAIELDEAIKGFNPLPFTNQADELFKYLKANFNLSTKIDSQDKQK